MEIRRCTITCERGLHEGVVPSFVGALRAPGMTMLLDFVPDALVEEEEGALRRWAGGAASKRRRESVLGVVSSSDGSDS